MPHAPHHIEVDGRKWRATDPAIPDPLRQQLVNELMSARRAVAAAGRSGDADAMRFARARVHDAKLALGERGAPWWEVADEADSDRRTRAAIRSLLRAREDAATICPSEAARVSYGAGWRQHMQQVRDIAAAMHDDGELEVRQRGVRVADPRAVRGPLRLARTTTPEGAHGS